ncbi:MAG: hypothetical protein MHM6MM_003609 [Cercozoa sp. M6MM]
MSRFLKEGDALTRIEGAYPGRVVKSAEALPIQEGSGQSEEEQARLMEKLANFVSDESDVSDQDDEDDNEDEDDLDKDLAMLSARNDAMFADAVAHSHNVKQEVSAVLSELNELTQELDALHADLFSGEDTELDVDDVIDLSIADADVWHKKSRAHTAALQGRKQVQLSALEQSLKAQTDSCFKDDAFLDKLVRRAQLRPLQHSFKGEKPTTQKSSAQVYDDTDFYQELLREFIAASTESSAAGDADAAQAVTRRTRRTKNNVDRKASKGRKIRFQPIPKLQNFMVPIPKYRDADLVDELFASLFGLTQQVSKKPEAQDNNDNDQDGASDHPDIEQNGDNSDAEPEAEHEEDAGFQLI